MKNKIIPKDQIKKTIVSLKKKRLKIVFTNGCFDLLHVGHVRYLKEARALGDCLIIGLNSDRSVRKIKDPLRPLISEDQRAEVLAALECVDYIVLFDEADPFKLIEEIRPEVLVKGADWSMDKIIGADLVSSYGGQVRRVELVPSISSSEIINRIISRYKKSRGWSSDK
ncbi:MAG: glycerol-3-phosphate cytidylyltransferase [Deltaproteobacteria bacterium RBG_13_43_22]|nr:MAG: glycerol-3-phosphate cytidylyltransferase [Deltaproteobacteria bacterium RBG_13_43_22]